MLTTPTVMISEEQIRTKIAELAKNISQLIDDDWLVVALLRGSFIFLADLSRELHQNNVHPSIDFLSVSSYGDGTTSKNLTIADDLRTPVAGKNILLLDDIYDTGHTLDSVKSMLLQQGAKQVKTTALIEKPARHEVDLVLDYVGFVIEDRFIVGYGLDHANKYRSLPYIGVLDSTVPV